MLPPAIGVDVGSADPEVGVEVTADNGVFVADATSVDVVGGNAVFVAGIPKVEVAVGIDVPTAVDSGGCIGPGLLSAGPI